VDAFSRLKMLRQSPIRDNCSLPMYLDQHERESKNLPKYVARIRTGNAEEFKLLFNENPRAKFCQDSDMLDHPTVQEAIVVGHVLRRGISIHEICEAA
jgi:DNA gyrase subunit B